MPVTIYPGITNKAHVDSDAATYIAAVEAADGQSLDFETRRAINAFVTGCKADVSPVSGVSNWTAMKSVCLLAGPRTLAGSLVPLRGTAPTNNNFVSGDYGKATGLKGNGSSKYLNTGRAANADPQDNTHLCLYVTDLGATLATNQYLASTTNLAGASGRLLSMSFSALSSQCNGANSRHDTSSNEPPLFLGVSRHLSASYVRRSAGTNNTVADVSAAPNANALTIFRQGNGTGYSTARMSFYSAGEAVDLALLNARLTTYMGAIQ